MRETSGWVQSVALPPPSLKDNTSDAGRLTGFLKKALQADDVGIDLDLLKILPARLRHWNYRARCVLFRNRNHWQVIGIRNPDNSQPLAGLAIDLGTSRVVLRLIDLEKQTRLAETAFNNPQISIGPDVLARIHFTSQTGGLDQLNRLIIANIKYTVG